MKPKKLRKLFRQQFGVEPEKATFETRPIEGKHIAIVGKQLSENQFRKFKRLHA